MNKKVKDWKEFKEEFDASEDEKEGLSEETFLDEDLEDAPKLSYKELQEELILTKQKSEENWNKALRATADAENAKRRAEMEITKAHNFGQSSLINSLLPVMDSLEQAKDLAEKHNDVGMQEGLELTLKLFLDALKKQNVEQIAPLGLKFNPEEHEAMAMVDDNEAAENSVVSVFQKGYKLNDRVIRPARVVVAKAKN